MPPTGGYGGNAGVHDAFNLAWKLSYVLSSYRIDTAGASLVRPDGHIVWRARTAVEDPRAALTDALALALRR